MPQPDWPQVHPTAQTLGDVELLAAGAFAPLSTFTAPLSFDDATASVVASAGGAVLVDEEGVPVAAVAADGTVELLRHPTSGSFRALSRSPAEVAAAGPHAGVLVLRPLLAAEVSALAETARDASVLLLVRTVGSAVPSDVLVKATLAAAERIPGATVVTVPLAPRDDPEVEATLAASVLTAFGATPSEVPQPGASWPEVLHALDEDDEAALTDALDPSSLRVLRAWRPTRARRGLVVFFTGLSGSGKSTVARALVDRLHETDRTVTLLDGDVARRMLSSGLGFSRDDRDTNIRRLGWVGAEVARHAGIAVLAPIAPFAATRAEVRRMVEAVGDLLLVWVATPLEQCERRDRKGLYAKARRGEIPDFTGISSPYEAPDDADLVIDTTHVSIDEAAERVWRHLVDVGWVTPT
jgi:sulfate adenylyltransferase